MSNRDFFNPLDGLSFRIDWPDPSQRLIEEMRQIQRIAQPEQLMPDHHSMLRESLRPSIQDGLINELARVSLPANTFLDQVRSLRESTLQFDTTKDLLRNLKDMALPRHKELLGITGRSHIEVLHRSIDSLWRKSLDSERLLVASGLTELAREAATVSYASLGQLTSQLQETDLLAQLRPAALKSIYAPVDLHARFTTDALNRLRDSSITDHEAQAIKGSLVLFNHQITLITAEVSPLIEASPNVQQVRPLRTRRSRPDKTQLNLPVIQERELLEQGQLPSEGDYNVYAPLAPASDIAEEAVACMLLYERCNEACRLRGKDPIFKPTTRGVVAASYLALMVATGRDSFDSFVDLLYILIYEGSGAGSTRLLVENGGVMERSESDALWDVKQLRSKRSRHDIEHGSEAEIRKKFRGLKEMLSRFGLTRFPQTPDEYRHLQRIVLRNLRAYLAIVAERLESESQ